MAVLYPINGGDADIKMTGDAANAGTPILLNTRITSTQA
jgi:hypothetical protein